MVPAGAWETPMGAFSVTVQGLLCKVSSVVSRFVLFSGMAGFPCGNEKGFPAMAKWSRTISMTVYCEIHPGQDTPNELMGS